MTDPATGQLRMYYEMCVPGQEFQRGVAMATSTDGIHWTKPALNVTGTTYTTSPLNNFVNLPQTWMGGPSVFIDPNAPANQRVSHVGHRQRIDPLLDDFGRWRELDQRGHH